MLFYIKALYILPMLSSHFKINPYHHSHSYNIDTFLDVIYCIMQRIERFSGAQMTSNNYLKVVRDCIYLVVSHDNTCAVLIYVFSCPWCWFNQHQCFSSWSSPFMWKLNSSMPIFCLNIIPLWVFCHCLRTLFW